MSEVTIGEQTFITGKLHVFDQFDVFRKVTPVIGPLRLAISAGGKLSHAEMFLAIAGSLASLPQEDINFVRDKCLAVVRYKDGDKAFPMMSGTTLMYQNLDLMTMLRLIWEVVIDPENLGPFIVGLLAGLSKDEGAAVPSTT